MYREVTMIEVREVLRLRGEGLPKKKERIKKQIYKNRELAIAELAGYIDTFYNRNKGGTIHFRLLRASDLLPLALDIHR